MKWATKYIIMKRTEKYVQENNKWNQVIYTEHLPCQGTVPDITEIETWSIIKTTWNMIRVEQQNTIRNNPRKDIILNVQINISVRNYRRRNYYHFGLRLVRRGSGIWTGAKSCAILDLCRSQRKWGNRNLRKITVIYKYLSTNNLI